MHGLLTTLVLLFYSIIIISTCLVCVGKLCTIVYIIMMQLCIMTIYGVYDLCPCSMFSLIVHQWVGWTIREADQPHLPYATPTKLVGVVTKFDYFGSSVDYKREWTIREMD